MSTRSSGDGADPRKRDDADGAVFDASASDVRAVLAIRPFRKLWLAGGISSFGDWLALLATTSLAGEMASDAVGEYLAVSGVFILRIAPAVLLGPLAGALADRVDRRSTMITGDLLRFALFVSIPLVGTLWWLYVSILLVECVSLFWNPAKDATVPNLLPPVHLETANQLGLIASYGTAPLAAAVFSVVTVFNEPLRALVPALDPGGSFLAVYLNALTFLGSAAVVRTLTFPPVAHRVSRREESVTRTVLDGLAFVRRTPLVRGLVEGMMGAFAAGGVVIGLAQRYVKDLGAGGAGYGTLFGAVFVGMALGLWIGPRGLAGFSRRRLFGRSLVGAATVLLGLALLPSFLVAVVLATALGACAGLAWICGYTLLGLEVDDEVRGRTFALVQMLGGVALVGVLALAPLAAAGLERALRLPATLSLGPVAPTYTGAMAVFLLAGMGMLAAGLRSYRTMDDLQGMSLADEIRAVRSSRREGGARPPSR